MESRIDKLEVKLMNCFPDSLKAMYIPARNCWFRGDFASLEQEYGKDKAIKLLQHIYSKGHLSILEQAPFQFQIEGMSRSCLAQLTRHRQGWSYAVQSQHYQKHDDFHYKELEQYASEEQRQKYYKLMEDINNFYKESMAMGIPRFIAREVLPNSTSVHLVARTNLKALDHFWKLRKGPENTPEIRELSQQLYNSTLSGFPELNQIIPY
jgi:thymidylate synthase (FAD)